MKRLIIAAAFALPLSFAQQPAQKPFFPLANHSWWEYKGTAKLGHNPTSAPLRIRLEVIEVVERNGVRAAWVRGNPLAQTDRTAASGDQVFARVGQRMYLAETARSYEIRARMDDPADTLKGLFTDKEFLLDTTMPVNDGAGILDGDYVVSRRGKNGFRTIRFTPGVGITEFRFADAATGESMALKLDASDVQPEPTPN